MFYLLRIFALGIALLCYQGLRAQYSVAVAKDEGANFQFQLPTSLTIGGTTYNFDAYQIIDVALLPGTGAPYPNSSPGTIRSDDLNNWSSSSGLFDYSVTNLDWFGTIHLEWRGMGGGFSDINNTVANANDYIVININSLNDDPVIKSGVTAYTNTGATATYNVSEGSKFVCLVRGDDIDGDTLTYTLSGTHAAYFEFDSVSNELEFSSASGFDYELPLGGSNNSYDVTLAVSDPSGRTDSQAITINVSDTNENPFILEGDSDIVVEIDEDQNPISWDDIKTHSLGYMLSAADPDAGASFTWSVYSSAVNGQASVSSQNENGYVTYTPNPDMYGTDLSLSPASGQVGVADKFTIQVRDNGSPAKTDLITFRVQINPVNDDAPIIDQNSTIVISENDTTPISLTVVDYDEGFTQTWEKAGGQDADKFNIDPTTGALSIPNVDDRNFEGGGDNNYTLTVRVTDDTGLQDTLDLIILISDINEAPVIDQGAGPINEIMDEDGAPTSLSISATDPDVNSSTSEWGQLTWSILSQPSRGSASITDASANPPSILYTPNAEFSGLDSFVVQVEDSNYVDSIQVDVTVLPSDDPPIFTSLGGSPSSTVTSYENDAGGIQFSAYDVDGGSITYAIHSGTDKEFFVIDSSTGWLEFNASLIPNFEDATDLDFQNTYEVTVSATDSNGSSIQSVIVEVEDVSEPAFFTSPDTFSIYEMQTQVGQVVVTDVDANDQHTFSIIPQNYLDDSGKFEINATSGELSFITAPNYESNNSANSDNAYKLTIRALDSGNVHKDQNVTVNVLDDNDQPSLSAGNLNPTLVTVSELTVGDTIIEDFNVSDEDSSQTHFWTLSGDDAQYFEVDPTSGELTLLSPLDFENPEDGNADNLYNLVLSVTDSHGSPLTSNPYSFQVLISAENEPPYLTGSYSTSIQVEEDNASSFVSPAWVAVDPESGTSNIQWSLWDSSTNQKVTQLTTSSTGSYLSIASLDGNLTFIPSIDSNKEMNGTDLITVIFEDTGGLEANETVQISIISMNDDPVITEPDPFESPIAHDEGIVNIIDYNASDRNDQGTNNIHFTEENYLSWSISGASADYFDINNLGALSFKNPPVYDGSNPTSNRYELVVTVSDEFGGATDYPLVVNVQNAPEAPVLESTLSTVEISEDQNPISWNDAWGGVQVTDPDDGNLQWSIYQNGQIGTAEVGTFDGQINYTPDPNQFGSDSFVVLVTDDDNLDLNFTIDVRIQPVNDAPLIVDNDPSGYENQEISWSEDLSVNTIIKTYYADDSEDNKSQDYSSSFFNWDLSGDDASEFQLDYNGTLTFKKPPDFEDPTDANSDNLYEIIIRVTDNSIIFRDYDLKIRVMNQNEPPSFTSFEGSLDADHQHPENTDYVYTATADAKDINSGNIDYFIGTTGDDDALFSVNQFTGEVTFKVSPDYELPTDLDGNNEYVVDINATDGLSNSTQRVTIEVYDVNEAPAFISQEVILDHNESDAAFSFNAFDYFDDPEKNASDYIYSLGPLTSGDNQFFSINVATGIVSFVQDFVPDFEEPENLAGDNLYSFNVQVLDGDTEITKEFKVSVQNQNDPPRIDGVGLTQLEVGENTLFVSELTALDQDIANSFPDLFLVVEGESIGWVRNEENDADRFSSINQIDGTKSGASFCISEDFDRDGDLDVALLEKYTSEFSVFENDGNGSFTEVTTPISPVLIAGSSPAFGVTGDLNEDGFPDLVIALKGRSEVLILQNRGNGAIVFDQINDISGVEQVSHIELGDVDGDGNQDIVVICKNSDGEDQIRWFQNVGQPWHLNQGSQISFASGGHLQFEITEINSPKSTSLGDVDQDGDLDLAVASSLDGNFSIFLNDGNGTFSTLSLLHKELGGEAHSVKFVDLNEDNNLDLLITTKSPSKFGIMYQQINGGGVFQSPSFFFQSEFFVNSFDLGDIDKDGDTDIVAATSADSKLRWFENNGAQFSESSDLVVDNQEGIVSISLGDASLTNAVLQFTIEDFKDDDHFAFRPRFSGNLFFKVPPDFENPLDDGEDNQFELKVSVTDKSDPVSTTTRNVVINVDDLYEAPVIFQPTDQPTFELSIEEHSLFVVEVNSTNDEDLYEDTFYSISGGLDADYFKIDENTGALNFDIEPDYENPLDDLSDGSNTYNLVVRATDTGPTSAFSEIALKVHVLDGNDTPVFNPSPDLLPFTLDEDRNLTIPLSDLNASDPEGGVLTWSIVQAPSLGTATIIDSDTNLFYLPNPDLYGLDEVILQITDDYNLTAQITLSFMINPVNDAPVITTPFLLSNDENLLEIITLEASDLENDVLIWDLASGLDMNRFTLSNSGILRFTTPAPDYENLDSNSSNEFYYFTATVSDGNLTTEGNFTVSIVDVPDIDPIISNLEENGTSYLYVDENNPVVIDLNFSDAESDNNLTLSLVQEGDFQHFDLAPSGTLSFLTPPDFETPADQNQDNEYLLEILLTDGVNPVVRSVSVNVRNINEFAPVLSTPLGTLANPILHPENDSFVTTLLATDDVNASVTFTISSGFDRDDFELNSTTGELSFVAGSIPDFETNGSSNLDNIYEIEVTVSDGIYDASFELFIGVSDLNEPPSLTQNIFTLDEDAANSFLSVSVFDPEDDNFTWDFLRSPDHGLLSNASGGYNYTPNENFNGEDIVQFVAIDNFGVSHELNATILVNPVNDPPTATDDLFEHNYQTNGATLVLPVLDNDSVAPDSNETETLTITNWPKTDSNLVFDENNQQFLYTPPGNFLGTYNFTYTLYDGQLTAKASVSVDVTRAPDLPNWKYLAGFGLFVDKDYPWIFHELMGWVYISVAGGENSATWMWNEDLGWFWTGKDYFEYFYSQDMQKWFFWQLGRYESDGPVFYDFLNDQNIGLDEFRRLKLNNEISSVLGSKSKTIEFVKASDYFTFSQKQKIITELVLNGSSPTLQSLIN